MQVHRYIQTVTTAGGTASVNTPGFRGGICRQVAISAGTTTTTFKSNITDENSLPVRTYGTATGILLDDNRPLIVKGPYTLQITNASADGNFTCVMTVEE